MIDKVRLWMEKEQLIKAGDAVIAGVSGGADSVCMLLLLLGLREEMEFALEVIHVEHGIRGEESMKDARFVEELCEEIGIPCAVCHVDVPHFAAEHRLGIEEAARALRYDCYRERAERLTEEMQGSAMVRVALAHHADDNAETILFQMVRGSGIRGLCGISAKRRLGECADIIRPLLPVTRREIETFLHGRGQMFREDATNADMGYSRNRLRHKVMPELERINDRAVAHISESAGVLKEIADYIEEQVHKLIPQVCRQEAQGCLINEKLFLDVPEALAGELVLHVLENVAGSRKDIGNIHVRAVLALAGMQIGKSVTLPYGMLAKRVYEGVWIGEKDRMPQEEPEQIRITEELLQQAGGGNAVEIELPDGKVCLKVRNFNGEMAEISKKKYTKWLDYDKIRGGLRIRKRIAGDYLVIDDTGHRKKLKEYFVAEKIPGDLRGRLWLVAQQSHVLWVVGGRISADCKIRESTKRILEIQFFGEDYREENGEVQ